jgi:CheY-like chemotaxis protein
VDTERKLQKASAHIRRLKREQHRLQEACLEAEEASNAKTTFLFNMSHDIRTPMNAMLGFTDLLEKHQDEPQKRMDYLEKIQESGSVLLSIINNVLEMARIEKGTLEVTEVAWSTEQFNDTLYSIFQDMMTQKGLIFTRTINVEHHYVMCDPVKLREVFINLLSNAYKYTDAGGHVHVQLDEIPSDREGYAMFRTIVSDTGKGMSEEYLPHLFEEFSRENDDAVNKTEGTGLGMPIVHRLVDMMGGTISVESKKGEGTAFTIVMPHRIADRSDLTEYAGDDINPLLFVGKRILLTEDNDLNAEIAIELLKDNGFKVERATDGCVCVDMLEQAPAGYYDVILMDIQMPNMNGYEAAGVIRHLKDREKSQIPILAMTANAFEEDKQAALHAGMNGHLAKPVNEDALIKALTEVIRDDSRDLSQPTEEQVEKNIWT